MLQSEVLLEVYFSTDFAAVIDVLFHEFRGVQRLRNSVISEEILKQADQSEKAQSQEDTVFLNTWE